MMHYLAAYIARKRPEAASFVQELDFARSLCQVPIDLLLNEANVLRSWYNQVLSSVKDVASASQSSDDSLPSFVSRAFAALAAVDATLLDLEQKIVDVKALLLQFCKCVAGKSIAL
jgi:hypothetical protein